MVSDSLDLVAASRVSRRVELEVLHLTEVQLAPATVGSGALELNEVKPVVGMPTVLPDGRVKVNCAYLFTFSSGDAPEFTLSLAYSLLYALRGQEPFDEYDLKHFADANGRYHTWPFAREMVTSLTAKMGYRPYVLPALSFSPKVDQSKDTTDDPVDNDAQGTTEAD